MTAGPKMRCPCCNTILQSMYRHDYKTCACPNRAMVDGGGDCLRAGCAEGGKFPVPVKEDEGTKP